VGGGLYFGIFDAGSFVRQLGGPAATRKVLDDARAQIAQAGLGRIHFAAFGGDATSLAGFKEEGFSPRVTNC
jgi:hypothetical protein